MAYNSPPSLPGPIQIRINPKAIVFGFIGIFVLIGLFSGIYQVPTNSVAVVQRFGGYLKTAPPGLARAASAPKCTAAFRVCAAPAR
jgi:hypothetical protein